MKKDILDSLQKRLGTPNLVEQLLNKFSPSELNSFLLAIFEKKAEGLSPSGVFRNYCSNGFVQPSKTDVRAMRKFEELALTCAENFTPVELSSIAPFGSCSGVASVSQNKVLSALRHTEVVADCTNLMALEAARLRKFFLQKNPKDAQPVHLCASHRQVRTQPLPDPRFLPHFKVFALCSAGRETGSFTLNTLYAHLYFYLKLMHTEGFYFQKIEVKVTPLSEEVGIKKVEENIFRPFIGNYPNVVFHHFPERATARNYYETISFQIDAENKNGTHFNLVDGGSTNWTQLFLNNKKERFFSSGIGAELVCQHFGT